MIEHVDGPDKHDTVRMSTSAIKLALAAGGDIYRPPSMRPPADDEEQQGHDVDFEFDV